MDAKSKWNQIYRESLVTGRPASVLVDHPELMPSAGNVLDIACGRGTNALFLARAGLHVDAWDISDVAIAGLQTLIDETNLDITAAVMEVTEDLLSGREYDMVVNCHYLDRSLVPAICDALKPGGLVFFQTFTIDKAESIGPKNPDFLLAHDELLTMFPGFEILAYRDEGTNNDPEHPLAGRAYLIARKPETNG